MTSRVRPQEVAAPLTPQERARVEAWRDDPEAMREAARAAEAERIANRRLWGVAMLALNLDVARSILLGKAVLAGSLDGVVLHHALRGGALPDPRSYIEITLEMLDAVAEAGPSAHAPEVRQ
jgi:hypothetical protein